MKSSVLPPTEAALAAVATLATELASECGFGAVSCTIDAYDEAAVRVANGVTRVRLRRLVRCPDGRPARGQPVHEVVIAIRNGQWTIVTSRLRDDVVLAAARQPVLTPPTTAVLDATQAATHEVVATWGNAECEWVAPNRLRISTPADKHDVAIHLDRSAGQLVLFGAGRSERANIGVPLDAVEPRSSAPVFRAVWPAVAEALTRLLWSEFPAQAEAPSAAEQANLAALEIEHTLYASAVLSNGERRALRTRRVERAARLGIRRRDGDSARRRAALIAIAPSAEPAVVAAASRWARVRPVAFDHAGRSLPRQVGLAAPQSLLVYLPAAASAQRVDQRARYLLACFLTIFAKGFIDFDTLRLWARRAAETVVPRRLLARVSVRKSVELHLALASVEAAARVAVTVALGVVNGPLFGETIGRRLAMAASAGAGEALMSPGMLVSQDLKKATMDVLRRDNVVDLFGELEQRCRRLLTRSAAVVSPDADSPDAALLLAELTELQRLATELATSCFGQFAPAGSNVDMLPTDTLSARELLVLRIGPDIAAVGGAAALAGLTGNVRYSALSLVPLIQRIMHAVWSNPARRWVAADDGRLERKRLAARHRLAARARDAAIAELLQLIEQTAGPSAADKAGGSTADAMVGHPWPWPYLARAGLVWPFPLVVALWFHAIPELAGYATATAVAAALGPFATAVYWELDRWFADRESRQAAQLAERVVAGHGAGVDAADELGAAMQLRAAAAELVCRTRELTTPPPWAVAVTPAGTDLGGVWQEVLARRTPDLVEGFRWAVDAVWAVGGAVAVDKRMAEWLPGHENLPPRRRSKRLARAVSDWHRDRVAVIAVAEQAWRYAEEWLPDELTLPSVASGPLTAANDEYVALCSALAVRPWARHPDGLLVAMVVTAASMTTELDSAGFTDAMTTAGELVHADITRVAAGQSPRSLPRVAAAPGVPGVPGAASAPEPGRWSVNRLQRARAEQRLRDLLLLPGFRAEYLATLVRRLRPAVDESNRGRGEISPSFLGTCNDYTYGRHR